MEFCLVAEMTTKGDRDMTTKNIAIDAAPAKSESEMRRRPLGKLAAKPTAVRGSKLPAANVSRADRVGSVGP
jgi:hypothetical protein